MNWEKFEHLFDPSWHHKIRPWVESENCDKVYAFLKSETKRGKIIAPHHSNVFRAFKETSFNDLKVVMMGLSPYHSLYKGESVADGLMLSCSVTGRVQPSLDKFYDAIERSLFKGLSLTMRRSPDLSYLANQGILLINAAMTTEINKPGSHLKIWEPFMRYLLTDVFFGSNVPMVFLGKEAGKYSNYAPPFTWTFTLSHPASAAYNETDWDCDDIFKKLNKILHDRNGEKIEWIKFD